MFQLPERRRRDILDDVHRYPAHPPKCAGCQDTGTTPGGDCGCPSGQRYKTEYFTDGAWQDDERPSATLGEIRDDNAHDDDVLDFCEKLEYIVIGDSLVFDAGAGGLTKFTRIS